MREWVELYPWTLQYLRTVIKQAARWAIATNSEVQVCLCDWTSVVVDKSNWLVNHYVILECAKGGFSESLAIATVFSYSYSDSEKPPLDFYGHSKGKGLKSSTIWILDSLISLQTESLSV